jgi:hypothetical protein
LPGLKKGNTQLNPINEEIIEPTSLDNDDLADLKDQKSEVTPK